MNSFFKIKTLGILLFLIISTIHVNGQSATLLGQDTNRNPIIVAVPFLSFAPDSRSSGMGDVGVATSPDHFSTVWNSGKLAFIESDLGFSYSYSPWLGNIIKDMSLNYLSFYKKVDDFNTFGGSFRYFNLGEINYYDEFGNSNGSEAPNELAVDGTYSRKLSNYMGMGVTLRFIWSNLTGNITGAPNARAATGVSIDIGWYYTRSIFLSGKDAELSFGAHLSNIGTKITYSQSNNANFIPTNIRLGGALKTNVDQYNSFTFALDMNKLMVPTPPVYSTDENGQIEVDANGNRVIAKGKDPDRPLVSGILGSFTDAPRGFKEELEEINVSAGAEYWYSDVFAARAGYFFEHKNKGGRSYLTLGAGIRYQVFGLDFSYLIPSGGREHPLADTIRLSLLIKLDNKNKDTDIDL